MADQAWIEVTERGYTRDGVQYAEGVVLRVPENALPNIVEVDPPRGRRVSREYALAKRAGEDVTDIDPYPVEEPSYQPDVDAEDAARDLAETYDIDLSEIEGTGEEGRVLEDDVVAALEARAGGSAVEATNAARELAEEHGIDLSEIEGTGQDGRILKSDVRAVLE
jgi:pyruvate/2-oxoglutarate dehydrogenase complex dihydrolipoamide acyltransferase (E2) component